MPQRKPQTSLLPLTTDLRLRRSLFVQWIFTDRTGRAVIDLPGTPLAIADDFRDGEAQVRLVFDGHLRHSRVSRQGRHSPVRQ
jgi:hypothetical protein